MEANISITSASNAEFNKLDMEDFVVSDYFPKDYRIQYNGQNSRKRLPK